ncbi:MAG: YsnF/AvaK domain-containing protein [bacterium]|nr:YsnF/AvaK domain-containing protein [bacterium]
MLSLTVDREISDADLKNFRPGEIELTDHAEVPIVGKQARVVEDVEIGKQVTERDETIRDTVRSTDVDVERLDDDATTNTRSKGGRRGLVPISQRRRDDTPGRNARVGRWFSLLCATAHRSPYHCSLFTMPPPTCPGRPANSATPTATC